MIRFSQKVITDKDQQLKKQEMVEVQSEKNK